MKQTLREQKEKEGSVCGTFGQKPKRNAAIFLRRVERVKGIEPSYPAWKAGVLPLNYTRKLKNDTT